VTQFWKRAVEGVKKKESLLFVFFFGFDVDLDLLVDLDPFVALLPLVDLETLATFVADDLESLVAEALVIAFVAALDTLVAFCWSFANNSATEAQPDAAKIRLIVGESSLIWEAIDALEVALTVDGQEAIDGREAVIAEMEWRAFRSFWLNGRGWE